MQKQSYYCDFCKKVIGEKAHVSLHTHNNSLSGIAMPPKSENDFMDGHFASGWKVKSLPSIFMHFHINCIQAYFEKWLGEIERLENVKLPKNFGKMKNGVKF